MNLINENALAEMIAKAVQEQRPRLEEDLTGRTIGINEFRRKYCGGKSAEWVRTFVFDRFPETDWANGGWCVNPHRAEGSRGTIIFEKRAAAWIEEHQLEIDWNERLAK
ncbi:hypothetical protein lacNasYZ03_11320 [Lactobacillus nasalidis]|uniref:DUF771 domain-containing protein n=1 Tax=Lactobacillus nasalidis TaxID=2797258 RepID=A0ABQ3W4J6_9LACO|nr:DUF771 domain-containing protein [Lactobacillus nasalidis]GHV97855.1 hypothetical protein lacNasYZ01_10370 [Lactobacillus nasalidis]GHW00085.1 hypothetical protein lacNasYZ02_15140 [Lactobacillus nasalidis]GHW01445.1 hypothetical protein lacNasYZ03_11320 [Lactobacillus nasalidis]